MRVVFRSGQTPGFEPAGRTSNSEISHARSLFDYDFRWPDRTFPSDYPETRLPLQSMADNVAASTTAGRGD